ncbi:rhamnogalacturonan acetylesterase [Pedobacter sp.]|uniref:rhamnogalacturonan acetylesterase n=1 Tax=Pedobacter sp. TaxID=1411316 RepID=UPI003D7F4BFD
MSFIGLLANPISQATAQQKPIPYQFTFGTGKVQKGFTPVGTEMKYTEQTGYGFDFNSSAGTNQPFYFSVKVPEGNYKVTLTLGDANGESLTTVKAESRRLMLENIKTKKGELKKVSFVVNVRTPAIKGGGNVSLKPREVGSLTWDEKLTLEFNNTKPQLKAIEIEKVENQVTVFLAGNSTVVDQDEEPWASWGQMIPRFFKPGVAIANHAQSGLSLGSFLGSHRLDKILSVIKPGDYLFVEFGHNDQKEKGPEAGAYGSYTKRLQLFIDEVRAKKAIPVIVTSTARRSFDENGKTINTLGDFPAAARKVAAEQHVALIDLNAMTTIFYDALGVEPSKKAFVHYPAGTFPGQELALADNTHFNTYGAYEIAKCIIEGIKTNHLGLQKYLIDSPAFNPSQPDAVDTFFLPLSPKSSTLKPDGN